MKKLAIVLAIIISFVSCEGNPVQIDIPDVTITQGLFGQVSFWRGYFTDDDFNRGTVKAVKREVYIFKARKFTASMEYFSDGDFFKTNFPDLIAKTTSNAYGYYEIVVPAGQYTVMVKENNLLYASEVSENGYINFVDLARDELKRYDISITYQAVFP